MAEPGALPRADAVVGWRYWQVAPSGRLRSVTQRRIEWPPGRVMRATCVVAGHRAPDERCDCGVHGSPDLETLRQHGLCLAEEPLVVGRVALWGKVVRDHEGWRGQYGEPVHLSVVRELVLDGELDGVTAGLAAYGVPVDTMALADAVAGVTAAALAYQAMAAQASRTRAE
ncbi:MAG TPA: hypothetical protein VHF24_05185 [Acidimicrobiales bacterium]|nr:hypothetical protein [Acidimicrobiales bacterium]